MSWREKLQHVEEHERGPTTGEEIEHRIEKAQAEHRKVFQRKGLGPELKTEVKKPELHVDVIRLSINIAGIMFVFFYGPDSLPLTWVIWSGIGIGETARYFGAALLYLSGF